MRSLKELMNLHGRTAVITGGAGHIGFSMAEALAELGADIALVDVAVEDCQRRSNDLSSRYGVGVLPIHVNLEHEPEIRSVPQMVVDHFGRVDILINCAALVGTSALQGWAVPFEQQSSEAWRQALDINLSAPFLMTQACGQALRASGHGSVINVGSIYGIVGPNWNLYTGTSMANPAAYGASKGGLLQLTRYLATALAPDVRVNMVTPGGVFRGQPEAFVQRYTANTPLRRMATEEDVKGIAAYLASDLSSYVTGQNFIVDGGWTVW